MQMGQAGTLTMGQTGTLSGAVVQSFKHPVSWQNLLHVMKTTQDLEIIMVNQIGAGKLIYFNVIVAKTHEAITLKSG